MMATVVVDYDHHDHGFVNWHHLNDVRGADPEQHLKVRLKHLQVTRRRPAHRGNMTAGNQHPTTERGRPNSSTLAWACDAQTETRTKA